MIPDSTRKTILKETV